MCGIAGIFNYGDAPQRDDFIASAGTALGSLAGVRVLPSQPYEAMAKTLRDADLDICSRRYGSGGRRAAQHAAQARHDVGVVRPAFRAALLAAAEVSPLG
jgi:hypothetical protein